MESMRMLSPLNCFRVLAKNKLFAQLVVVGSLALFAQAGVATVLPQLLQVKLAYSKQDLVRHLSSIKPKSAILASVSQYCISSILTSAHDLFH